MADGGAVDQPLVSIVIPVHNGANYVAEAIDSALAQTYRRAEVVVVDDGSDDDGATARVCAGYGTRIRYFYKVNGGVATALNYGIQVMRGAFFSWLSHDDAYTPDRLATMVEEHRRRSGAAKLPLILSSDIEVVDETGAHLRYLRPHYRPGELGEHAAVDWGPNGCSLLIPRVCFERAGLLHPQLPTTQDADMWVRMRSVARFEHVAAVTVRSRAHDEQGSRTGWHLRETVLNRLSVLDRLDSGFIRDPDADAIPRYHRLLANPALRIRPGVHQNVRLRLGRAIRQQSVALLWAGMSGPLPGEVIDRLLAAGLRVSVVPLRDPEPAAVIGQCGDLDADLVWLWDRPIGAPVATLRCMLEAMVANPSTVGCVHEAGMRRAGAPFGAWHGALLPTRLFRDVRGATPDWLAIAHAAVRHGRLWQYRRGETDVVEASDPPADAASAIPDPDAEEAALYDRTVPAPSARAWRRALGWHPFEDAAATAKGLLSRAHWRLGVRLPASPRRGPTAPEAIMAWIGRHRWLAEVVAHAIWRTAPSPESARLRLLRAHALAGHFDADWYLRAYPDVARAGIDPLLHYLTIGQRENRDPSAGFDTTRYRAEHADVAARGLHPLQHYVLWGRFESRRVHRSTRTVESGAGTPIASGGGVPALVLAYGAASAIAARLASDLGAQLRRTVRPILVPIEPGGACRPRDLRDEAWLSDTALEGQALAACLASTQARRALVIGDARAAPLLARLLHRLHLAHDLVALDEPERFGTGAAPAMRTLVASAAGCLALSSDVAVALSARNGNRPVDVVPMPDPGRLGSVRPWPRILAAGECCRVALFGTPDADDGQRVLLDALEIVHAHRLPFVFVLYGLVPFRVPGALRRIFRHVPAADDEERTQAVARFHPHVAWIPYEQPARAVFPLADAARSALPIVACDSIDARSYLAGRPLTWLRRPGLDARRWLDLLRRACHADVPDPWRPRHPLEGFAPRDGAMAAAVLRGLHGTRG